MCYCEYQTELSLRRNVQIRFFCFDRLRVLILQQLVNLLLDFIHNFMKIIIPPIYKRENIDLTLDEHDIFQRKKFINNLSSLFRNTSDGLVITIDSQWGEGKTTLIKQWEKKLSTDDNFIPIYYDAFRNDFSKDPFLSIAVEIHEALEKEIKKTGGDPKNKSQLETLKKHTIAISTGFLRLLTRSAVTSLTGGLFQTEDINKDVGKSIENLLFSTIEHDAKQKFQAHLNLRNTIDDYQSHLKSMLSLDKGKNKKIVFFVDELDRCRPIFAIEVIEKIKHLFSTDNVFFVLAINKKQLLEIIKHNYGIQEGDGENYLQKFVHIETKLPPLDNVTLSRDTLNVKIRKFIDQLLELHELSDFFKHRMDAKKSIVNLLATFSEPRITPRAIERTLSLIAVALGSSEGSIHDDSRILNTLCNMAVLKTCAPELYQRWKNGQFTTRREGGYLESIIFDQLKKNFQIKEKNEQNDNSFSVEKTEYVCGILDIYTFYKQVTNSLNQSWNG